MKIIGRILPLAALMAYASVPALCQAVTGTITGIVTDSSGAVVPNAKASARNMGTAAVFSATADTEGVYWLRNLPVGSYSVNVEASGFQKFEATDVRLQVNETARVDVRMKVGSMTETVTVQGNAVTVDTTTSTLKAVVDQKRIEELPLNGRNATQLMRLIVGVTNDPNANVTSGTTYPGSNPVSVNGGRSNTTNYVLDGAQNNDVYSNAPSPLPNPDALQEFSVQTNNFSAEFGRQSGGVVNAITKSGTNDLHGSAFEFLRNQSLNAANYFSPVVNGQKLQDGLKRNQFGGTLGGPLLSPKVYNGKDRTFFFASYQSTIIKRAPVSAQRLVATAAQKAGDFSAITRALRDPLTGQPYPGNLIPATQWNAVSRAVLEKVPNPVSGNTIFTAAPNNSNDDQVLARGDHAFSDRNRISGRYYRSWASASAFLNPANYLERNSGGQWINESVSITDTHSFTPTLINQALFSFTRTDGFFAPPQPDKSLASLGLNYYNDPIIKWDIDIAGYFRVDTGDTNSFPRKEFQYLDTLRWSKGKHQITMGGEYSHGSNDIVNNFRANGQWSFNGSAPFTTDALADFLIGRFNSLTQGIGEYKGTRIRRFSGFFQDSWKVSRRFTLDLGVRWEPFLPYTDSLDKIAVWRPGEQSTRYVNAPRGVIYAGDSSVSKGTVPAIWHNIGPRVGMAWDVFGDGKTSLRGGYGVFYDWTNTISTNSQANQAPFGTVVTVFGNATNNFNNPWAGASNPFPASLTPDSNVAFPQYSSQFLYSSDFRNPYVQSWNLTLERELVAGFVMRTSYAASKGTRLGVGRELNPAIYAVGATTATTNQRRPYGPALGSTPIMESVSNSTFHSLQWTLERRFSKGLTILANYQFAKSIDDTSQNKVNGITRTNPFDQAYDKGLSEFHRTHVFNFSGLWDIPWKPSGGPTRFFLGGWSVNGIVNLNTGQPFTVTSGVDNARTGAGNQRADLIGDPFYSENRSRQQIITEYLRKAVFVPNAIGTYGNLGRNTFFGPGMANVDAGLVKNFQWHERVNTFLRFEAFNVLNRVNLNNPTTAQNNGNFMRITSANDPRILQVALRVTF
ncbi:MAG TPA: carboxypeptidase regulatory-like domain-containing protein [Bryobacteraceae bacterium]|nr:carboxypeptidase regulatory-like domain-containing protein [Bryobacteraceae bacterium]